MHFWCKCVSSREGEHSLSFPRAPGLRAALESSHGSASPKNSPASKNFPISVCPFAIRSFETTTRCLVLSFKFSNQNESFWLSLRESNRSPLPINALLASWRASERASERTGFPWLEFIIGHFERLNIAAARRTVSKRPNAAPTNLKVQMSYNFFLSYNQVFSLPLLRTK